MYPTENYHYLCGNMPNRRNVLVDQCSYQHLLTRITCYFYFCFPPPGLFEKRKKSLDLGDRCTTPFTFSKIQIATKSNESYGAFTNLSLSTQTAGDHSRENCYLIPNRDRIGVSNLISIRRLLTKEGNEYVIPVNNLQR